ncbi:MAG: EamA family transporter, partial [Oceanospirillaceae bacterium]
MELIAIWAVVLSAALHAIWNYFLKQSSEPNLFVGLSKIVEALLFAPLFIYFYQLSPFGSEQLIAVAVASLLVFLNYYFLSLTYQHLEMSLAYPISRSSTLFLPFLVWFFLGQTIDLTGAIALTLILLGVALLSTVKAQGNVGGLAQKKTGILLALLVAFIAALQTLWAKIALNQLHPFLFFYSYTFVVAMCYLVFTLKKFHLKRMKTYFEAQWRP